MRILPLAAALALAATPALGQNQGLVVVDLTNADVANNIARDLDINVSEVPVNVQLPIGIAAAVCDVNASVLAHQKKTGSPTCKATSTNASLNKAVQQQMLEQ
jgi:hypothetical protein